MGLSRQRLDQLRNIAAGCCAFHKNEPLAPGDASRCAVCLVAYKAKRLARRKAQQGAGKRVFPLPEEWAKVDWRLTPMQIARQMGVTLGRVYARRKRARLAREAAGREKGAPPA